MTAGDSSSVAHSNGGAFGENWLFFGCRRRDHDYLYGSEFEKFAADGTLTVFDTAFSRESEQKVWSDLHFGSRTAAEYLP